MPVTRSCTSNGSRNPSNGASPVYSDDDDDRSPSPLTRTLRVRRQTPSAAAKKSDAKSDSPPRGRTMTRTASRGASPAVYARSDAEKVKSAAAAHYQPLNAKYPDSISAPSVLRGYRIRPLIFLCHVLLVPVPEAKVSDTTMAVRMLLALSAE